MRTDEMLAVEELHSNLRAEIERLRAALKVAAQWVPFPDQAYTPDARRDAEIVQAALNEQATIKENG